MTPPRAHRCGKPGCDRWATLHLCAPHDCADRGTLHCCKAHAADALIRWHQLYPEAR